ncbi:hypothetical protein IE81DRAFT_285398 [Ceraceosorus guamensis]|uniref:Uncharacterized protein n=1 Tax=Ceraceosorus guamensis TaxID=1522189 RepID=A0A316WDX8_9BASI|nr:hypothetical protein IE81DRAFT_285398 [Ceraceosorus guamensis]PWN45645.1 hypothetical protein IE81DRAFT_285398 [Ceraceosorus guamensis]
MVTGSGARVPTQLVSKSGRTSSSPFAGSNGLRLPIMNGIPKAAKGTSRPAIDLTADGSDDEVQVTGSKKAEQEVELDRRKTNSPVCLGVLNGVIMCMYGLPESLQYEGDAPPESVPQHPAFRREHWPSISHFWSQPGYRPILLSFSNRRGPETGSTQVDLAVSTILPPLMVNAIARQRAEKEGKPPPPPGNSSQMQPAFGALAEKYRRALLPLLNRGDVRCEARCKLVNSARGALFLHPIEILIFTEHSRMGTVTSGLLREGCSLEHPVIYEALDYPDSPRLIVQQHALPAPAAVGQGSNFYRPDMHPSVFTGGWGGQIVQTKEQTEEERKQQVETVYASLRSGEDLEEVEANSVVTTDLFPHQKQALAFLLDREKERSFDVLERNGKSDGATNQEEEPISLWRPKRRPGSGKIVSYTNVVTNGETSRPPEICRGAILADDMGLGKTITTIALIANSWNEAKAFGKSKLVELNGKGGDSAVAAKNGQNQATDDEEEGFASGLPGAPAAKTASSRKGKDPANSKSQAKKDEAERARQSNLRTRSRATLIVLPLTLVSSWEEQIKEHWHNKYLPKRLIYHGQKRSQDPIWIANHDIVFTTYPTLANEFSRQKVWVSDVDGGEDTQDDPEGSDDDIVPLDSNGVPQYRSKSSKKGAKRRKSGPMVESKNPLQRIEWFRIVLDEAHTIKEARTWQSKAVCNLSAQRRLCLTGTPVQNRMDDLYSLIKFLRLEPLNDRAIWNEFCGSKENKGSLRAAGKDQNNGPLDSTALRRVQTIMKFLTLRRSKDGKRKDGSRLLNLPPKYNRTMLLQFTEHERAVYTDMHQSFKEEIEAMKKTDSVKHNYATILHEISNLRMSCDHFALVDDSKDSKRKKDGSGRYGVVDAIKKDGLTRQRALELFKLFADEEHALCSTCGIDLTHIDTETGKISSSPVVTRCQHLLCTPCFRHKAGSSWPKGAKADQKVACPACDVVLAPLTECLQLAPAEIQEDPDEPIQEDEMDSVSSTGGFYDGSSTGRSSTRRKPVFGVDADKPVLERPDLSTKIQALLSDLIPFSKCNPASLLYDEEAALLDHQATPSTDKERKEETKTSKEPVVVVQHPSLKAGGPANILPIKSVVFSQWTKMLDRVANALERAGIRAARLDGSMPRDRRAEEITRFKEDPSVEVFLVSLKVGGTGLNLVQACRAYILEPYWNPAAENQGLDRVHRMGQVRPVITTKYVVAKSIEERMLAVQKHKMELARSVGDHGERRRAGGDLAMLLDEMAKS